MMTWAFSCLQPQKGKDERVYVNLLLFVDLSTLAEYSFKGQRVLLFNINTVFFRQTHVDYVQKKCKNKTSKWL